MRVRWIFQSKFIKKEFFFFPFDQLLDRVIITCSTNWTTTTSPT